MDLGLSGRVALVVGGTGYIGSAITQRLRAEGATVIAAARSAGADLVMDGRDAASTSSAVEQVLTDHGRLDALVVTAAPSARTLDPARNADPEQVLDAVDAKAMTFLRIANAVLPVMREAGYGRIVGISGQNAFVTGNVTGSVRNAALIIAAKNLDDAVSGRGVSVNAVSTGLVTDSPTSRFADRRLGAHIPQHSFPLA